MIPNYHFGESLKKYLDKHGITNVHVANIMGVSPPTFNSYFKAENPRKPTQEKILKALGITIEVLYDEAGANEATEREKDLQRQIDELRSELIIYQKKEIEGLKEQVF